MLRKNQTKTTIKTRMGSRSGQIGAQTAELAALNCSEKIPIQTYNGRNLVITPVPSFLDGSTSFLQLTRKTIKAWLSLNYDKIPSLTTWLAALERLKNQ